VQCACDVCIYVNMMLLATAYLRQCGAVCAQMGVCIYVNMTLHVGRTSVGMGTLVGELSAFSLWSKRLASSSGAISSRNITNGKTWSLKSHTTSWQYCGQGIVVVFVDSE
jgi:hypothetical protein